MARRLAIAIACLVVLVGCPPPYPPWHGDDASHDVQVDRMVDATGFDADVASEESDAAVDVDAIDLDVADSGPDSADANIDTPMEDVPIEAGPDGGCPGSLTNCFGNCVDLATNPFNCGGCGARCGRGFTCEAGACVCNPPRMECTGATPSCRDPSTTTDCQNCLGCGVPCHSGWCIGGRCVPFGMDCSMICSNPDCNMCPSRTSCL